MRINIPNQITLARLAISILFFALISRVSYRVAAPPTWLLAACFWIFLVAALSDVLDGLLARAWQQVTAFGRVLDPVVDKVLVCGAYVFFCSPHFWDAAAGRNVTGVEPWMVVLILLRELLVSAIRAQRESQGHDFSAVWIGKVKMFAQCATACVILGHLAWYPGLADLARGCVLATVAITTISIIAYVGRAYDVLRSSSLPDPPRSNPAAASIGGRLAAQTDAANSISPAERATAERAPA